MMEFIAYTQENFPVETDLCIETYNIISQCMNLESKRKNLVISKLHGTRPFYTPRLRERVRILFGTIYTGEDYAEVGFSKAQVDELGRLEVGLFGLDRNRLIRISEEIRKEVKSNLNSKK